MLRYVGTFRKAVLIPGERNSFKDNAVFTAQMVS